jgi:hypothetical protein
MERSMQCLKREIQSLVSRCDGRVSVRIELNGETIDIKGNDVYSSASLIKIPKVMNLKTIKGPFHSFKQLVNALNNIPKKQSTLLIGIDGCGGSRKSTYAEKLKKECSDVTIVHMDDYYLPSSQILHIHPTKKPIGAVF